MLVFKTITKYGLSPKNYDVGEIVAECVEYSFSFSSQRNQQCQTLEKECRRNESS